MADREIRYCTTSDGFRIAYGVEGAGPSLLMTPLTSESFVLEDMSPAYREFSRRLGQSCQLIQYDCRGIGSSKRGVEATSWYYLLKDMEAVFEATGLDRVSIYGRGMHSCTAILFASCHPTVVERLVLHAPLTKTDELISREEALGLAQMARGNWDTAARALSDFASRREFGDKAIVNAEWYRQSATGEDFARLIEATLGIDVSDELANISCPTLVLQPMNDARWTPEVGQRIAASIDHASLVPLKGGLHHFALGDPEPTLRALLEFIGAETRAPVERPHAFRTILFTDVEGSTALTDRLGDAKARELLREHERMVREALKAHSGSEFKTLGDGFMTSFSSAVRALECAIAMQRAFAERNESAEEPILVRIGLNAGEPIAEDDDLYGTAVNEAARITATAKGGEILASNVVRELVKGKDFEFSDRGEATLKGFDEPVRLHEVRWSEEA